MQRLCNIKTIKNTHFYEFGRHFHKNKKHVLEIKAKSISTKFWIFLQTFLCRQH